MRERPSAELPGDRVLTGFLAWFLWRTYYLSRLPGLDRKLRVAFDWTLELLFPRDISELRVYTRRAQSSAAADAGLVCQRDEIVAKVGLWNARADRTPDPRSEVSLRDSRTFPTPRRSGSTMRPCVTASRCRASVLRRRRSIEIAEAAGRNRRAHHERWFPRGLGRATARRCNS